MTAPIHQNSDLFVLDTSFIVNFTRKNLGAEILTSLNNIFVTVITLGELEVGINSLENKTRETEKVKVGKFLNSVDGIFTIDDLVVNNYGKIKADLSRRGELIGDNDTWIAAITKANSATLITDNPKHFRKVIGLKLLPQK